MWAASQLSTLLIPSNTSQAIETFLVDFSRSLETVENSPWTLRILQRTYKTFPRPNKEPKVLYGLLLGVTCQVSTPLPEKVPTANHQFWQHLQEIT